MKQHPSIENLKRAIKVQDKIETLQKELERLLSSSVSKGVKRVSRKPRKKFSAKVRARMAKAARKRWAKRKKKNQPF